MNVNYKAIIKDSASNLWEFDKVSSLAWQRFENEVGSCRFLLPYSDTKLTNSSVQSGRGQIRIYRNDSLIWQGLVALLADSKDGTMIYGHDFLECLKWCRTREEALDGSGFEYTTKMIGSEIISPMWDLIAARTNPPLGTLITKGTIQDPYQVGTSTAKTISKTFFNEDFFSFLKEAVALSRADSPSGAWKQDTAFEITLSEATPTFNFWRDVGTDKADVRLELDSEIVDFTIFEDARYIRNGIVGYTVTEDPKVLISSQVDATSRSNYYLRDICPVFGLADKQTSLDEHTKDYLKEHKDPRKKCAFQFASGLKPFDGYSLGDAVKVIIKRGRANIDDFYRVYGMVVNYEAGVEMTTPLLREKRS